MIGVLPVSGVGAWISGSTPEGGHKTPSDRASLSPSGSARCPVVVPSGAMVPRGGAGCIGVQLAARPGAGGAVWAGGVAGTGGACAPAGPETVARAQATKRECFIRMQGKRPARADVPCRLSLSFRLCGSGSARNAPSAASGGARSG
jgi:hypothetical protein